MFGLKKCEVCPWNFSNARKSIPSGFGVNDGLISNFSLVMGIVGAEAQPRFVVLAGVAGLLAGDFSMAAGEYVSVRSLSVQRQVGSATDTEGRPPQQGHSAVSIGWPQVNLRPIPARGTIE
jgi:hypothetical protein